MEGVVEVEAVEELHGCCLVEVNSCVQDQNKGDMGVGECCKNGRTLMSVGSFR